LSKNGCVQGSPAAMRTGPEASKTETVNSALYVKGGSPCTQSLSLWSHVTEIGGSYWMSYFLSMI